MTSITEKTIVDQYAYWLAAPIPTRLARTDERLAIVGCGSSYNLALAIAAASNEAGIASVAVPGNEWRRRPQVYLRDWQQATLVALSRSGESTETVAAARQGREQGLEVIGITCEADSSLARAATLPSYSQTDPDEGIVMTTSASLMLLAGLRFGHVPVDVTAAVAAAKKMSADLDASVDRLIRGVRHVVYLGAGAAFGIAVEGGLKLQEMSQVFTQAYHPLEYRHGPISLVDESTLVVILYSADGVHEEAAVARDVQGFGARVLGIGGPGEIELPLEVTQGTRLLATLPALQLLGERMAASRSLDTTAPRHLTKVVRLASAG